MCLYWDCIGIGLKKFINTTKTYSMSVTRNKPCLGLLSGREGRHLTSKFNCQFSERSPCAIPRRTIFEDQVEGDGGWQPGKQLEYHPVTAIPAYGQSTIKIQKREDLIPSGSLGRASERSWNFQGMNRLSTGLKEVPVIMLRKASDLESVRVAELGGNSKHQMEGVDGHQTTPWIH